MYARHVRNLLMGGLSVLVILSFALSMTESASAQVNPYFTIFPEWEWFDGMDWPDGAQVSISVKDKPECVTLSVQSWDGFFNGGFSEGCDVVPGDAVTFEYEGTIRTHTVRNLAVTSVDELHNTLSGTADAGESVYVWPHETGQQIQVSADSQGVWLADFNGIYDIQPGTDGRAEIRDEAGNATAVDWRAPDPRFTIFPEWEWFDGMDWPDGAQVNISVTGKPECDTLSAQSWDGFFNGGFPEDCDIAPGDEVTFEYGGISRTHTVRNLAVTSIDAVNDTVSGIADEGETVYVWPHETGEMLAAAAVSPGIWLVDFAGKYDIVPGSGGRAQIQDEGGNTTTVEWFAPNPSFGVFPEGDIVEVWEWPLDAMVELSIDDPATPDSPDYTQVEPSGTAPWDPNTLWIWYEFPEAYNVKTGDVVTLSDGSIEITHIVRNLSITAIDPQENTVAGSSDPFEEVFLWSWEDEGGSRLQTAADAAGSWAVDFDDIGFDLEPGYHVRAEIWDGNGNHTAVDQEVPQPPPSTWRDEFDGSMDEGWEWFDGVPANWNLNENDGFLRIYAATLDAGGFKRLLRPVSRQDFMIKTHVLFEPGANFQFAGLVIYQDDENYLELGRGFCDLPGFCVGNGIYFDYIGGGGFVDGNFATPVDNPSEAYLRLERRGEMVRGFFSADGFSWYEIGIHWIPPDFQVNGVGLIAIGDAGDPGEEIIADFDFFELTEGGGFLPEGFHDFSEGDVPAWECNAGGWAADPDHRGTDLNIEIIVDDQTVALLSAGEQRDDLYEVCDDGTCSFNTSLWGVISSYEPHTVSAWAQDDSSGEWVLLYNSPKTLTCRTFDIYTYDLLTGAIEQVTFLTEADEYNPSWSPNGKLIAHHVVHSDGTAGFYITDVRTGVSTQLEGVENSSGAVFSPNGKWIAFHMPGENDSTNAYIIPVEGGGIELVRENAQYPDWAPNGKRLVFEDLTDSSIRSVPIDGGNGSETLIAGYGHNPAWSPDGNWIAYNDDGDVWKVAVNVQGTVFGDPVRLTDRSLGEGHATWSADSQTIVFHAGMNPDYDLWSIPASGGEPTWLNGAPGVGDYDPAFARNSSLIAYASASPNGQVPRPWAAVYTGDLRTWDSGDHRYFMDFTYAFPEINAGTTEEISFSVSEDAPGYDGVVLLRPHALRARIGDDIPGIDSWIQPHQPTRFHFVWVTDVPITYADALALFGSMQVTANWDEDQSETLIRQDILPWPSIDWEYYLYLSTYLEP